MNYTVVFVEDEQIVREEIVASVRWELLGLTLVGTAADGMEGEEMIKALEPDIVDHHSQNAGLHARQIVPGLRAHAAHGLLGPQDQDRRVTLGRQDQWVCHGRHRW